MKKTVLTILVVTAALFLIACGDSNDEQNGQNDGDSPKSDLDSDDSDYDDPVSDQDYDDSVYDPDTNTEIPDQDSDGCVGVLDSAFLEPMYDNYFTLRQTGIVFDYNDDEVDPTAIASESQTQLGALDMAGDWGAYLDYNGTTLLFQTQGYDFMKTDETNSTTRIQLVSALGQFHPALIPAMIENNMCEVEFGAFTFVQEVYIDAKYDSGTGAITEENTRRNCMVGISATEEVEEDGETYDSVIGKIYGCFDCDDNPVGAIGETLKMMFNLKMTVDEEKILEFINTRDDGTIAAPGDDDYEPNLCTCFSLYEKDEAGDPVEIDCADFDPSEPLFPDKEIVNDDDVIADEDTTVDEDVE